MSDRLISREDAETDVLAAAAFIAERIASSDGRAEAMNAIVPRLLLRDKVDLAAALADTIDDPYSRDRLLISVAERCVDLGDDEYARQLADAVEDDAVRSQAFENVAIRMAAKGDIAATRQLAESVEHPDFIEAAIAAREAADGNEEAARATIETIEFAGARVSAFQEIAAAAMRADRAEAAVESLNCAIGAAMEIEHNEEKIRAMCDIGSRFIDAKRNDLATQTFLAAREEAEQLDNIHREYFLGSCAVGLLHAGSLEEADATLDLLTDKTQMASAMVGFARDEWKRDEKETALETLDEAYKILKSQHEKETRDSKAKNALMAAIAVQFAGFGKTEKGVEVAHENADIDEEISALSQIGRILIMQNETDLSRETIEKIPDDAGRLLAMLGVSDELKKRDKPSDSIGILDEISESATTINRPVAQSRVVNEMSIRYIAHDSLEKARRASLENLSVIATIRDDSNRAAALAAVDEVYAGDSLRIGDEEAALLRELVIKAALG